MEKEIKVVVDDPWMGERELPSEYLGLIIDQLKLLKKMRDDGRKPSAHLLQDIRIYEYILSGPNANHRAHAYMEKISELRERRGFQVKKIEAVRALGWPVN